MPASAAGFGRASEISNQCCEISFFIPSAADPTVALNPKALSAPSWAFHRIQGGDWISGTPVEGPGERDGTLAPFGRERLQE